MLTLSFNTFKETKLNYDNQRDLVLGIEDLSEKKAGVIKDEIESIQGVIYKDYCPKMNLILLTYDETKFESKEFVVKAISRKLSKITFQIKEGSILDIQHSCFR